MSSLFHAWTPILLPLSYQVPASSGPPTFHLYSPDLTLFLALDYCVDFLEVALDENKTQKKSSRKSCPSSK
jgi:hypothetical protein